MGRKIIYLLAIFITFLFGGLYLSQTLMILFWMELFLFAGLFFLSRFLRSGFRIDFAMEQDCLEQNTPFQGRIVIANNTFLPITRCKIWLEYRNSRTGKDTQVLIESSVSAGKTSYCRFPITEHDCGLLDLSVKKAMIFDYLGFFHAVKKTSLHKELAVLPKEYPLSFSMESFPWEMAEQESSVFSLQETEPADYQLRSYQPGDYPKNIHWKLHAKTDELWTKMYQTEQQYCMTLFLDLYSDFLSDSASLHKRSGSGTTETANAFFTIVTAISTSLLNQDIFHKICWYDFSQSCMVEYPIKNKADYRNTLKQLYLNKSGSTNLTEEKYREEILRQLSFSCLYLNQKLEIFYRQELQLRFQPQNLKEQLSKGWLVL